MQYKASESEDADGLLECKSRLPNLEGNAVVCDFMKLFYFFTCKSKGQVHVYGTSIERNTRKACLELALLYVTGACEEDGLFVGKAVDNLRSLAVPLDEVGGLELTLKLNSFTSDGNSGILDNVINLTASHNA